MGQSVKVSAWRQLAISITIISMTRLATVSSAKQRQVSPARVRGYLKVPRAGHAEVPRIQAIRVKNYRALQDFALEDMTPLTALLGPNGSGKSTVFDVFTFLSECFTKGLRPAWDERGRMKEIRSRGSDGSVTFELRYQESSELAPITYRLEINEDPSGPFVARERLTWKRDQNAPGRQYDFLKFENSKGWAISGDAPDEKGDKVKEKLTQRSLLAVNTLGQFEKHPRVSALRKFITGWHLSYLSGDAARGFPAAGPHERLSKHGDNLANVVQYLKERHQPRLKEILNLLSQRVPRLERVDAELLADGRLLMKFKDEPFKDPVLAKYASDGTLKLLAYLILLHDPQPSPLIGIEEPENFLHHRLLPILAEECRNATDGGQLLVTTHSPFFVNAIKPQELWMLYRNLKGYTVPVQVSKMPRIKDFIEEGASLGELWIEGQFEVGDPLTASGGPRTSHRKA